MVTREAPMDQPLMPERIRPGDLSALHVFDRFDMSVQARETDIHSPDFQRPSLYRVTPRLGAPSFMVHPSRECSGSTASRRCRPAGSRATTTRIGACRSSCRSSRRSSRIRRSRAASRTCLRRRAIPVLKIAQLAEKAAGAAVDPDEQTIDELGPAHQRLQEQPPPDAARQGSGGLHPRPGCVPGPWRT